MNFPMIVFTLLTLLIFLSSANSEKCSAKCFFNPVSQFVNCYPWETPIKDQTPIACESHVDEDGLMEVKLGNNKDIVRSIAPGALRIFGNITHLNLQLSIFQVTAAMLKDQNSLETIEIYTAQNIDNDAFVGLHKIDMIYFDKIKTENLPSYLLLQPEPLSRSFTISLRVSCHRCSDNDSTVVLTPFPVQHEYSIDSVMGGSCAVLRTAEGCPQSEYSLDRETGVIDPFGYPEDVPDTTAGTVRRAAQQPQVDFFRAERMSDADKVTIYGVMFPGFVLFSVWCSILSLAVLFIMFLLWKRRRSRTRRRNLDENNRKASARTSGPLLT